MSTVVQMHGFKRAVVDRPQPAMQLGVDQALLISALLLLALGIVMVASASMGVADRQSGDPLMFVRRHVMYAGLGIVLAVAMQRIRLVHWEKSGATMVLFAMFLLILVLIPGLGHTVNGATRWLDLGVVGLQASEPARLLLILYLAGYLVRRGEEVRQTLQGFLKPMLLLSLACVLVLLEPDFGSAAVLLLTTLGMMYLAGVRFWHFIALLSGAGMVLALLAVSSPYRMQRLTAFLDPWSDPFNTGFQLTQSLIAFGSGGWAGAGLGRSVQKLFYLPEAHNDFLFAILAEELGLVGVILVIGLFAVLIWRGFAIAAKAERSGHLFGAYLANGITLWFAIQSMVNIGVNMGVLPTKGLTLPLVSAGGSSMLVMCAAVGLLLRVNLEVTVAREQVLRNDKSEDKDRNKRRNGKKTKGRAAK